MTTFGIAGVQMNVAAFQDNVDRMGGYMRHIRVRFPWVRMVMFSELATPQASPTHLTPDPARQQWPNDLRHDAPSR